MLSTRNRRLEMATQVRQAKLEAVVQEYSLQSIYAYSQKADAPHHANAYHNPGHCARVALRAFEILCMEGNRLRRENAIVLVAGFFHDFGHKGSNSTTDKANIETAVEALRACDAVYEYFGDEAIKEIEACIRCTEYDYATKSFPVTPIDLTQEALRDADLMESLEPEGLNYIKGLCIEVRMAYTDFLPKQIEFIQNAKMFTASAQHIWESMLGPQIALYEDELAAHSTGYNARS